MLSSPYEQQVLRQVQDLETPVRAVEERLTALGLALHQQDALAVEREAGALHVALSAALQRFRDAARQGAVPAPLRQRLARASGQMAAQREALARATAALDRAMDVLMPEPTGRAHFYSADGLGGRAASSGSLLA
jgi:hypothetical protein